MPYQLPCARGAAAMAAYRPRRHLALNSLKVHVLSGKRPMVIDEVLAPADHDLRHGDEKKCKRAWGGQERGLQSLQILS